jgi:imidazole glycerol-phosphate synthase subunit HisF
MLGVRVIPSLLLRHESLVKTKKFGDFTYVGDPANTVRIFNELEVDELFFLDIVASKERRGPNFRILRNIADECFMPLGYGGGITSFDDAKTVFDIGFEKVSLNTAAVEKPQLISQLATHYGSQAVVVSIDVKAGPLGKATVRTRDGENNTRLEPVEWAKEVERRGAGEILLTSIDREGSWSGFDLDLIRAVSSAVSVPVIAHGGAGTVEHIGEAVHQAGASAVALGSMVVFQKKDMGVLVHYPDQEALRRVF